MASKIKRLTTYKSARTSDDKEFLKYDVETEKADSLETIAKALQEVTLSARGKDGIDGKTPTKEELVAIIKPLIPEPIKGDTPTKRQLIEIIKPLIPAPKDGIDGIDADEEMIVQRVTRAIPIPKDGEDGKDGSPDMAEDIRNKLELLDGDERLDARFIKNIEKYAKVIYDRAGGFAGSITTFLKGGTKVGDASSLNIVSGTNMTITSTYDGNTASYTFNSTSGGGFTTLTPTEIPNGTITVFTFPTATAQPSFINRDGTLTPAVAQSGAVYWTWNNATKKATMTLPPSDILLAVV